MVDAYNLLFYLLNLSRLNVIIRGAVLLVGSSPVFFDWMKDKEHIDFTNETMRFINKLTDEIYESLIDKEYEDLYDSTTILIEYLIKLQNERLHQVRSRVVPRGEQD